MKQITTKTLTFLTLALFGFTTGNAQMISRSSISAIAAPGSNDAGIRAHAIGKMNLSNTSSVEKETTVSETQVNVTATLSAYPIPAISNINFTYELPETATVNVSIFSSTGQKVADVAQQNYNGGKDVHQVDLSAYPAGVYFLHLDYTSTTNGQSHSITREIQIIK